VSVVAEAETAILASRYAIALGRLRDLAERLQRAAPSMAREAADLFGEFDRLARDLGIEPDDVGTIRDRPLPPRRERTVRATAAKMARKERAGERHCAKCDEWLPLTAFDVKNHERGTLRSWCRECMRKYQRERYVRIGERAVAIELLEGDGCLGERCGVCFKTFRVGDRVAADHLRHERCGRPS